MLLTKICVQCGTEFPKPYTESRNRWNVRKFCGHQCKADSQKGKLPWNAGMRSPSKAQKLPCRICGEPTKYNGTATHPAYNMVHCDKPECIEASRILKNLRIATKHNAMIADGTKRVTERGWDNVQKISQEEIAISPWLESFGWIPQYKFLTGVHSFRLPRMFRLDFALPAHKLYIEIDGSVHKHKDRKVRDERRNQMMDERGWRGLRIPSAQIRDDIETTKHTIATWFANIISIS
jgi:hypothetical protein